MGVINYFRSIGSWKITLQSIAGVEEIIAGQIYIDKQRVDQLPPPERDVAMVFEMYAFIRINQFIKIWFSLAFTFRKLPKMKSTKR